jgi:hypothetical protein
LIKLSEIVEIFKKLIPKGLLEHPGESKVFVYSIKDDSFAE